MTSEAPQDLVKHRAQVSEIQSRGRGGRPASAPGQDGRVVDMTREDFEDAVREAL